MDGQKKNRIAAALAVNVILLIAVLAAVLIYQLVEIAGVSARRKQISDEIARYEQLIEEGEKDLEYLQSEQYLLDLAFKLGYYYPQN